MSLLKHTSIPSRFLLVFKRFANEQTQRLTRQRTMLGALG